MNESLELFDLFDNSKVSHEKIYYKIGEVSKILNIKPSVLRFWESEFSLTTPKTRSNQRIYKKKDIQHFLEIKKLLYQERFTIEGAKKRLRVRNKETSSHLEPVTLFNAPSIVNAEPKSSSSQSSLNAPTTSLLTEIKQSLHTLLKEIEGEPNDFQKPTPAA